MRTSETINELAAALSKAQAQMAGAKKDSVNPHFKSKYADLSSVWEACREALTAHGLSVVQSPRFVADASTLMVEVETILMHASGQFMADTMSVPVTQANAQGVGSALTYARRYALSSVVGVAPEDDDAEGAVRPMAPPPAPKKPAGYDDWFADLGIVAAEGSGALKAAWEGSSKDCRGHLTSTNNQAWELLKRAAATVKK